MTDHWIAVAALVDPSRRALFDHVRRQDHPVGREEAAEATAMSRGLAAFHLDKLVEVGLLAARYEAPPGQVRGRGRTPKVYEVVGDGLSVSLPERRYELIADILAEAVAVDPTRADAAALRVARERGHAIGAGIGPSGVAVVDVLAGLGFEPRHEGNGLVLGNCPFHALTRHRAELVCGLNHQFVAGVLEGLGTNASNARLAPRADACCVEVSPTPG